MFELVIPEDGFVSVTLNDATKAIDAYRVYNLMLDLAARAQEAHPDETEKIARGVAYFDALCGELEGMGFGKVSRRTAERFDAAFFAAVTELKKADAGEPAPA